MIVVPSTNPARIQSVSDLAKSGVKVVVAGRGVPAGSYTIQVLNNMKITAAVLANVVSRETDVREVLAKVALAEADAGFVYSTDAKTAPGKVEVVNVPAGAKPTVRYGICVVSGTTNRPAAQAFVKKVMARSGQARLIAAGFLPRGDAVRKRKK